MQYLAPIGGGVKFVAGKFGDLFGVGTESVNNIYSWNIRRGNVWSPSGAASRPATTAASPAS